MSDEVLANLLAFGAEFRRHREAVGLSHAEVDERMARSIEAMERGSQVPGNLPNAIGEVVGWDGYDSACEKGQSCGVCGFRLEMYYRPKCFRCQKPRVESRPSLNLIEACRWLEAHGHEGAKGRLFDFLSDSIRNDIFLDAYREWCDDSEYGDLWSVVWAEWDLGDTVLLEISW